MVFFTGVPFAAKSGMSFKCPLLRDLRPIEVTEVEDARELVEFSWSLEAELAPLNTNELRFLTF